MKKRPPLLPIGKALEEASRAGLPVNHPRVRALLEERRRRGSKYHNIAEWVGEIRFPSRREANAYRELCLRWKAGELVFPPLLQVPFRLPGRTRYRVDFLIQERKGGRVRFLDAKGALTPVFLLKQKQVEDLYGIRIELI